MYIFKNLSATQSVAPSPKQLTLQALRLGLGYRSIHRINRSAGTLKLLCCHQRWQLKSPCLIGSLSENYIGR